MTRNEEILVSNTRDPLYGKSRAEIERLFRERLAGRVRRAYFFGSFAADTMDNDSDIDLLLVRETDEPFIERPAAFFDMLDIVPTCDILVYTPDEFAALTRDPSAGFWQDVTASMKRLI